MSVLATNVGRAYFDRLRREVEERDDVRARETTVGRLASEGALPSEMLWWLSGTPRSARVTAYYHVDTDGTDTLLWVREE